MVYLVNITITLFISRECRNKLTPVTVSAFTSNRRYVDPEGKSPDTTFRSKSSFALLIESLVICMKYKQTDLMRPQELPSDNVRICLCSHRDSVDDRLLTIAQVVNENKSQNTGPEKTVDFASLS